MTQIAKTEPKEIVKLAQLIWDYHHMNQPLKKADALFVLCSHDLRVADRAVELFKAQWAPLIIFSGGLGNLTLGVFKKPEAELFAERAILLGVPKDKIIIENKSTNTGENVIFTKRLLEQKNINPRSFILVQKPYMERRTYATFKKRWPEKEFTVTSPQLSFDEYCNDEFPRQMIINIMVGDLQRIIEYPKKGFQIYQEVPPKVLAAMNQLIQSGYTENLIK